MALANYRFLPWTRRGLVKELVNPDPIVGSLPAGRGSIRVAVAVNHGAPIQSPAVRVYGPGDVTGFDTRVIVRAEPRPRTPDFEANYLAAVDFDTPDFPWMLTPAAPNVSGGVHKLRPWLVLVVLDRRRVELPKLKPGRQLPSVEVPQAAFAGELPDLDESWAWAHAQVAVAEGFSGDLAAEVADKPNQNVSRLLCPRQLEPGASYFACLVPAFNQGVVRGLGGEPDPQTALAPAWSKANPAAIELPVYYHWEFQTGQRGDFEELARRLEPFVPPEQLGYQKVYLHPEELELAGPGPSDPLNYSWVEGALKQPELPNTPVPVAGQPGAPLATLPAAIRSRLEERLNEPAASALGTPGAATQALAPPIYGSFPINEHQIRAAGPTWQYELNLDPRARVVAGLGAEIVRKHQEAFVQSCWEQVDQVLRANELLNRARFALEIGQRVFTRILQALPAAQLLSFGAPLLARLPFGTETARAAIRKSSLVATAFDPALRRLLSAERPVIKRALLRGGSREPHQKLDFVTALNTSAPDSDPSAFVPDGLSASRALERAADGCKGLDFRAVGLNVELDEKERADLVRSVALAAKVAARGYVPLRMRGELERTGVMLHEFGFFDAEEEEPKPVEPMRDKQIVARYQQAFALYLEQVAAKVPPVRSKFVELRLDAARQAFLERTAPTVAIPARVQGMLSLNGQAFSVVPGGPVHAPATHDRVMVSPKIEDALYGYLAEHDSERFLPGVGAIPVDSIVLLATNRRFVEAFLIGANHEMARELLWRNYPTDQRGTVFQRFWEYADAGHDVPEIHRFDPALGLGGNARQLAGGEQIVMLVRGQLLRRYPGTVVLAWRGELRDGRLQLKLNPGPGDVLAPAFSGRFAADFTFFGFALTPTDVANDSWFLVLQEQPGEPRFGFDTPESDRSPALNSWLDATWSDAGVLPGAFLTLAGSPLTGQTLGGVTFGRDAAHMAAVLLQRPFRVALDARKLLNELRKP